MRRRAAPALAACVALLAACGDGGEEPPSGPGGAPVVPDPPDDPPDGPPPPTPSGPLIEGGPGPTAALDGLAGLRAVSVCTFEGGPADAPVRQRLEALHVFPDRVRWTTGPVDEEDPRRRREYRYGARAFVLEPGAETSSEYPDARRASVARAHALRRATLLWPATAAWTETHAGTRVAVLRDAAGEALGELEATLDADGRPSRVTALAPDGAAQESLDVLAWGPLGGRTAPTSLRLVVHADGAEQAIWTEELQRLDTDVRFLDDVFLPPDRRPAVYRPPTVEAVTLPPATWRELPLPPGAGDAPAATWPEAVRAVLADVTPPPGEALEDALVVALGPAGRPAGVLVRLANAPNTGLDGWTHAGPREAVSLRLPRAEQLDAAWMDALLARAGERAGAPYARLLPDEGGVLGLQVVVPLR